MQIFKKLLLYLAGQSAFTLAVHLLWHWLPKALTENAVMGWLDDQIGAALGLSAPDASTVVSWTVPFGLVALMLWGYHVVHNRWVLSGNPPEQSLEPQRVIALGAIITLVGLSIIGFGAWQSFQRPTPPLVGPPIEWRFDKPVTIFLYSRKVGEGVWIDAIMIHATNKTDKALKNVRAAIIPDMTGQKMIMRVNPHGVILKPTESATLIPPRANFDLTVAIPSKSERPQGLPAEKFLADYGSLRFAFEYDDGISFTHEFSLAYLEDQIAYIEEKTKESRRGPSTIPAPTGTEEKLLARARFLYDQRTDTMRAISKQDLDIVTVEKNTDYQLTRPTISTLNFGYFTARFAFPRENGPFDVSISGEPIGPMAVMSGTVLENEKSYVKVQFFPTLSSVVSPILREPPTSAEITVSFYRR